MTPSRGYLVRSLYEWLLDNDLTPQLVVSAEVPGTEVPQAFVSDGQITLNVAPSAVRDLQMTPEAVSFSARFSGQPMQVYLPIASVLAIFARENGVGMGFGMEPGADQLLQQAAQPLESRDEGSEADSGVGEETKTPKKEKRATLKVVK